MSETRKGAHSLSKSLADPKTKVKIGCWNARTMFSVLKTAPITSEMVRYGIDILGISECSWSGFFWRGIWEILKKIVAGPKKRKQIACKHDMYLSNRPQVSMVYRLINHAGCWKITSRR